MPWTAPDVDRREPPYNGDERAMLEGWLDFHRQTLLRKCSGLTAEELRRRAEPSTMSLLGLVRHMAEVERSWFVRRFAGEDIPFLYVDVDSNPDGEFDDVESADSAADFATYAAETERARRAVAGHGLDETFFHAQREKLISLRWVYLHMIEEYARHNGHADLMRERIDGQTGQ